MDIEGAFDNTQVRSIVMAAEAHGVNKTLTLWIGNMLRQRTVIAQAGPDEVEVKVVIGCPQGGVLSPTLWCLVIDELLVKLNNLGYFAQGYADDIIILLDGLFTGTICQLMQSALNIAQNWCQEKGLRVNPTKTTAVLFTRKTRIDNFQPPSIFGCALSRSTSMKYLGVVIDSKLNWKQHLETKLAKASKAFWQCRRAFGRNWGLTPNIILWFYEAIIRPIVSYGSIVWWKRVELTTVQKSLEKFQRMICIGISGAMRTTPTAAMEVILSMLPLHIFLEQTAMITAYRLICTEQWCTNSYTNSHAYIQQRMLLKGADLAMPSDKLVKTAIFQRNFKVIIPNREEWLVHYTYPPTSGIVCYTDGSLMDGWFWIY